ncbi:MAG: type II secretion system major pseudopilin GspG [Verrucomicrobiota bacterium]|jgi:general secretion pathway protein G|nr:type II secretion system major pseudopilin GspG [Verrucomicrobiota bacterium]|tara:strand:+ start:5391 stop:5924 length:534 start_codon:yes stop_codon:yes gene_type:complete
MKLISKTRVARSGAFTLIEILLVLVIIGLLAGSIVAFVIPQQEGAEKKTTQMLVNNVKGSLDNYRLNIGHYPTEEEGGLLALMQKPEFENEKLGGKWQGPYVKAGTTFEDPWSNALVYEPADPEFMQAGDPPYRLYSKGPDGQEETDDDIGDKEVQEEADSLEELSESADPVSTGDE